MALLTVVFHPILGQKSSLRSVIVSAPPSGPVTPPLLRRVLLALLLLVSLPAADAQFPGLIRPFQSAEELLTRADRSYDYGREVQDYGESRRALQNAIPLYEEFLRRSPNNVRAQQARYRLGMSQLLTGRILEAEANFESIIRTYKTGHYVATAAYRIAAQHYNGKRWAQAAPYFAVAAQQTEKPDLKHKSLYYRARCLILANEPAAARATLNRMIEDPSNPFRDYARLASAQIEAAAGNHEKALQRYEELITLETAPQERAQALIAAGNSAAALGDEERASNYLQQALRTPGFDHKFKARAQLSLMEMRFNKQDYAGTIRELSLGEFSGEDTVQARIYLMAGRAFAQLDRHSEAIRYFFNAQRRLPRESRLACEAAYRRLLCFYHLNDPLVVDQAEAFIDLYGTIVSNPQWLNEARLMKAEVLLQGNRALEAADTYREIDPEQLPLAKRSDYYFKMGWALAEAADFNGAAQSLSRLLLAEPDHPQRLLALAQRGRSYLEIGDRKSALKDFEDVLEADPPPDLALFVQQNTGRIYRENRRYKDLVKCYQDMLASNPGLGHSVVANANYWIGWAHFKLDDFAACREPFETARRLDPSLYNEPASVHLMLAAYSRKDAEELKQQVDKIREDFPRKVLPVRMLTWLGLQMFQKGDFKSADDYLSVASTPDEPSYTDLLVWRHLAKTRLAIKHYDRALDAIAIMIESEERKFWKADAYLDQAHAFIGQEKWDEAREAAHEGLALDPPGAVKAGLQMALGDIAMRRRDFESAAASYLRTADLFIDDTQITPLALFRAATALEAGGNAKRAGEIRADLTRKFPNWRPPAADGN